MTNKEFKDLVAVWRLPTSWLAKHVAGVSKRSFDFWCTGRTGANISPPDDVVARLQAINAAIGAALDATSVKKRR